jgi:hypothetical protein
VPDGLAGGHDIISAGVGVAKHLLDDGPVAAIGAIDSDFDELRALAFAQVGADGFSQIGGASENAEQVVLDLKGSPQREGVRLELLPVFRWRIGQCRPQTDWTQGGVGSRLPHLHDVCRGAAHQIEVLPVNDRFLHAGELGGRGLMAWGRQVGFDELSLRQATCQAAGQDAQGDAAIGAGRDLGQVGVDAGAAAALHIVIHDIVMNEQSGLQDLHRQHRLKETLVRDIEGEAPGGVIGEGRTQALAAAQSQVCDGIEQVDGSGSDLSDGSILAPPLEFLAHCHNRPLAKLMQVETGLVYRALIGRVSGHGPIS